jgi:Na+/H+ antiporter NhaA
MNLRMANIRFGLAALFVTAVMGGTFNDQSVQDGNHLLSLARFYMREGHSHGNFMSFFNLFVGLILNQLSLSEKLKKICSYGAMASFFLPIGLAAQGFAGAPEIFPPIGLIGIIGIATALLILIVGAFKTKQA